MEIELRCPECGRSNPDSARACPGCGSDLGGRVNSTALPPQTQPDNESTGPHVSGSSDWAAEFDESLKVLREESVPSETLAPQITEENLVIPTYVKGLDGALGGGIPERYIVLLEGSPGTMKSSLACWLLAHNAVHGGRHGVYVSLEENAASLSRQMKSLGLTLRDASDRMTILDSAQLTAVRSGKEEWLDALRRVIEPLRQRGLKLFVLDSLEALDMIVGFRDRRDDLFQLFEFLRDLQLTSFIIAERSEAELESRGSGPIFEEDFLADGIIQLRLHPIGRIDVHRRLRVYKMRGVRHETDYLALQAGSGEMEVVRILGG